MRKSSLEKNHGPFDKTIARYEDFMRKIMEYPDEKITVDEQRDIAESIILRSCAYWEYFVEQHLIDCVNRFPSELGKFLDAKIPKHPDKNLCKALIIGGDRHISFGNMNNLNDYAGKVLPKKHNPFSKIKEGAKKKISEIYKIRNYLSHYSSKAKKTLRSMYKSTYNINNFYEPGQFLLVRSGIRLFNYLDAFKNASSNMKEMY